MKPNRLDPEYLRNWRVNYVDVCADYKSGRITLLETIDCFRHLGFKDDALKAEWITLEREKNHASNVA